MANLTPVLEPCHCAALSRLVNKLEHGLSLGLFWLEVVGRLNYHILKSPKSGNGLQRPPCRVKATKGFLMKNVEICHFIKQIFYPYKSLRESSSLNFCSDV